MTAIWTGDLTLDAAAASGALEAAGRRICAGISMPGSASARSRRSEHAAGSRPCLIDRRPVSRTSPPAVTGGAPEKEPKSKLERLLASQTPDLACAGGRRRACTTTPGQARACRALPMRSSTALNMLSCWPVAASWRLASIRCRLTASSRADWITAT